MEAQSLQSKVLSYLGNYFLDHSFFFVGMVIFSVLFMDVYNRYYKIDESEQDMMSKYIELKMRKRYGKNF